VRPDRLTGVERYALGLAGALARLAPAEVVLFRRPDAPEALARLPVEQHAAPLRARLPVDQAWLPLAAARARVDVLHTPAFPTPLLWRGPAAVTVHDATPWLHPEAASRGMRLYYRPLYPQALARARAIFTVSHAARADLVRRLRLDPRRVHVTHDGVEPAFFAPARPAERPRPYLLAVGSIEPRKNLPVLLEAFRRLRRAGRDLDLVVAGRFAWGEALAPGEAARHVHLAGPVSDAELRGLYAGAACFVLPSAYEGFGLPLAEALAAGAPAVASDLPALHEVGGPAPRYAPPGDPAALAARIGEALDAPAEERRARAERGRAHVRRFRWDETARGTLAVLRAVLPPLRRAAPARAAGVTGAITP
jgi:glycosyltransferase involved in cell wall biosynthesis